MKETRDRLKVKWKSGRVKGGKKSQLQLVMKRRRSDDGWKGMSGEAMNADMNTAKTHILPHLLQKLDPYLSHWLV